jgi:hypothetical protein
MLQSAFKEWAVICEALALGRQALILRKGGIEETAGTFTVEHTRFWLYPTYTHQQHDGVAAEARELLDRAEAARPPGGTVRLSHWVEVTGIYRVRELLPLQMLAHLHVWSDAAVEKRFAYREPGLHVLSVRVYRAPEAHVVPDLPAYQGCRSWVPLETGLATEGSAPVLDDAAYRDLQHSLDLLLNPTALA